MYEAIIEVGAEHFTLSSDAGDTVFPNSVEALRQLSGYMSAFGVSADDLDTMCIRNPAKLVGLDPDEVVRQVKERAAIAA
jgi:hypothetical protein